MKFILSLFLLTFFTSFSIYGQKNIDGRVINSHSHSPIKGIQIYIKNTGIGTVTNEEGEFHLDLENTKHQDSLVFSTINYKDTTIEVKEYISHHINTVELKKSPILLKTVIVKPINIQAVLNEAIERYDSNYYPIDLVASLKEVSMIKDSICKTLNANILLKNKRKKLNIYLTNTNQIKKVSNKIAVTANISQVLSFMNIKRRLIYLKKNLKRFTSVKSKYGNFGKYKVIIVTFKAEINKKSSSIIKLILENDSKAVIQVSLSGGRGKSVGGSWRTIFQSDNQVISYIPCYSFGKISFRPYQGKWMLSNIKSKLLLNYSFKEKSKKINKKGKVFLNIRINSISRKRLKHLKKIDPQKDLFTQIKII